MSMRITKSFEKVLNKLGKSILRNCELPKSIKKFVKLESRAYWLDFQVRYNDNYVGTLKVKDEEDLSYRSQCGLQNRLKNMVIDYASEKALQEVTNLDTKISELKKQEENYLRRLNGGGIQEDEA